MGLQNHSCRTITVRAKLTIANFSAANVIPCKLAHKEPEREVLEGKRKGKMPPKLTWEQINKLLMKLEFKGLESVGWTEDDQQDAISFLTDYGAVFAENDVDLGKHLW